MGIISVVIGGHFGGGDHFDGGDHFGGGTAIYCLPTRIIALLDMTKKRHWRFTGLYSIVHHNASPIKSRACRYWVDLTRCQGLWKLMVFNLSVIDHHENARSLSSCHRLLSGQKKCTQNERNHVYWRLQYWHTVGKLDLARTTSQLNKFFWSILLDQYNHWLHMKQSQFHLQHYWISSLYRILIVLLQVVPNVKR